MGAPARIRHFGGGVQEATIAAVHDEGRRLEVRGEDGEGFEFVLNAATARFLAAGPAQGARLEILPSDPPTG